MTLAPGTRIGPYEVVALLERHNQNPSPQDDVEVVTFSIGANDLRAVLEYCMTPPLPTPAQCQAAAVAALTTVAANLQTIMSTLREAAGPDAPDRPPPFSKRRLSDLLH